MTTVAYRDGVLAADTLLTTDEIKTAARKIFRIPNGWIAVCGDWDLAIEWVEHLKGGDKPRLSKSGSFGAIYSRNGKIFVVDGAATFPLMKPYHAVGTGARVALGAMFMGASAKTAVKAAMEHDLNTGGSIECRKVQ